MKHIKKFNENSKNNEIKVTLDSYKIVEIMEYSDGYVSFFYYIL
jgi:hypothetical protein